MIGLSRLAGTPILCACTRSLSSACLLWLDCCCVCGLPPQALSKSVISAISKQKASGFSARLRVAEWDFMDSLQYMNRLEKICIVEKFYWCIGYNNSAVITNEHVQM